MFKYAKVINEQTGLCEVGLGTNTNFYKSIGMVGLDVQQSDIDEAWYLKDKCPMKTDTEKLQQAKETKLKEILDKAYEYENQTGLVSFDGRVSETETQVLHTELFNQGKFFQMVIGFSQGVLTGDQLYNTKEDINVLINSEEAQAIYFAIKNATEKLWTVDYLYYKKLIEQAETIEDVEAVEVDYTVGYVEDTENVEETTEDSSVVEQGD
uniref:DUF4376 domain-containing protein n=1 Tax=Siphoviridae sp. ctgn638 TaxID=2827913 RepID=A0A8S5TKQ2_9CAUD|nr:MAG TPA: hypothetical protein [Siphoviridae sp. ctgn638]